MVEKVFLSYFQTFRFRCVRFHQSQIITRYLTKRPKLEAAKELRTLSLQLAVIDRVNFENELEKWHLKREYLMNERSLSSKTGKSFYTHKRLRSAYFSLKNNLSYLFNHLEYKELGVPNTINMLDGSFSDLKNKLRNHNGLNLERKKKFIEDFFSNRNKKNRGLT